jgi:integrase
MTPTETESVVREWGSIRNKGGKFYVRFTAEAVQHERGPFTSWNAADKMRRRARTMIEDGMPLARVLSACFGDLTGSTLTFRDAIEDYLTHARGRKRDSSYKDDEFRLKALARAAWAGKPLSSLKPADFMPWITTRQTGRSVWRLRPLRKGETRAQFNALPASDRFVEKKIQTGVSQPTIVKDLSLVSALLEWAIASGYLSLNPMKAVRRAAKLSPTKGRPERVHLTAAEAAALIAACGRDVRMFILAALHTGARRGELLGLRWRAIDLERRAVTIEAANEKTGRGRSIPMTSALHAEFDAAKKARKVKSIDGSDRVFLMPDETALTKALLRDGFAVAVANCEEIPKTKRDALTLHGLRHTAASLMVAAGVPILDVARILGHSNVSVTMRYARFAPESGRSAIDALGNALAEGAKPKPPVAAAAVAGA